MLSTPQVAGVLGEYAIPGAPFTVESLARQMHSTATDVKHVRNQLRGDLAQSWEGQASGAFQHTIGKLPDDLEKIITSYTIAGQALEGYAGSLHSLQDRARDIAGQILEARRARGGADAARTSAKRELDDARRALSLAQDPALLAEAKRRLTQAGTSLERAASALRGADGTIERLRKDARLNHGRFDEAVQRCCDELIRAGEAGIKNTAWSAIKRHVIDTPGGRIFIDMTVGTLKAVAELPGDLIDFVKDPSLDRFMKLLDGVGAALAIAGVVAAIILGPLALPVLIIAAVGLGVSGFKLGVHTKEALDGERDWSDVGIEAGFFALSAISFGRARASRATIQNKVKLHQGLPGRGHKSTVTTLKRYGNWGSGYGKGMRKPMPLKQRVPNGLLKQFFATPIDDFGRWRPPNDFLFDVSKKGIKAIKEPVTDFVANERLRDGAQMPDVPRSCVYGSVGIFSSPQAHLVHSVSIGRTAAVAGVAA